MNHDNYDARTGNDNIRYLLLIFSLNLEYFFFRKGRSRSPNFNTSCYTYTCCMVPLISLVKKIPMGFTPVITAHCLASSCTEPGLRTKVLAEIKAKNQKLEKNKKKKKLFFFWEPPPPTSRQSLYILPIPCLCMKSYLRKVQSTHTSSKQASVIITSPSTP